MSIVVDLLYQANIKIIDKVSIKRILELVKISFNENIKTLKIEIKNQDVGFKPYIEIELFDENEDRIDICNSADGFYIESDFTDFLFGIDCECVLGKILNENQNLHDNVIDLYNSYNNESRANELRQELRESLITFEENKDQEEPLIVVQLNNFFGEIKDIKMEIKDIQYKPTSLIEFVLNYNKG